ncbi:MAG: hypothetical protein ACRDSK_30630 [Actinophytocola sp.]|uniref:hypothetical protein n=1 Tax=Actinophytocola sp. TaxID=1872138 RepID=UPI003D6C2FC4
MFVIVVDEGTNHSSDDSSVDLLLGLVGRPPSDAAAVSLTADCRWSVVHPRETSLRLTVRASAPTPLAVDILVPAQCFLGLNDVVARGAAIGVTTRQHARRLVARIDRSGLPGVVLLGCRTSGELSAVANVLCRNVA